MLAISDMHVNMTAVNVHDWSFCGCSMSRGSYRGLVSRLRDLSPRDPAKHAHFFSRVSSDRLCDFHDPMLVHPMLAASGQKRR